MSALLKRFLANTKRFIHRSPVSNKSAVVETFGDPIEHATGLEKRELLAQVAGNEDPFDINKIYRRGPGTKAQPNEIPSAFDRRLVGCVCEEGAVLLSWMWLYKGEPKRCECGHWFTLVHKAPV